VTDLSKLSDDDLKALYARQTLAQRDVSKMSDDELRAAAYVQPEPPAGVTIHGSDGKNYLTRGVGKAPVEQSQADALARFERERGGGLNAAADVAGSTAQGIPLLGPFIPRAAAGAASLMGNGSYADNLAMEQARARTFDEDRPVLSTGAKIGGAVASTLAAAPAAAGSSVFQTLLGLGGKTLPQAMVRGGIAGSTQGIASGVGESADLTNLKDTGVNAAKSGLIGLGIGSFIPAAVGGIGQLSDKVLNRGKDALSPLLSQSRSFLERTFLDPAAVRSQGQDLAKLGPNAMLADVSPEWQMVARAGAARPGSRSPVVEALAERNAGKNARLDTAVTDNIGGDVVPSQFKAAVKDARNALSPEYDAVFNNAKAVDTAPLANKLEAIAIDARGAAQKSAKEVRDMLNVSGTDVLDPNPRTLHQVRMAIDGMLDDATDGNVIRVLKQARGEIDNELANKVPGIKPIDAKYAEISRRAEAFKQGQQAFDTGRDVVVRPSELEATKTGFAQPPGSMQGPPTPGQFAQGVDSLSGGARSEIWRLLGTNSNDVAKLNQLLKSEGDWNRDKLRILFGKDKADKVLSVLDAERRMEATHNAVVGGSPTASTSEYVDWLKSIAKGREIPTDTTLTGATTRGVQKVANMLLKSGSDEKADQISRELAKLSVATGGDRDAIVQALLKRGVRQSQLQKFYDLGGAGGLIISPVANALAGSDRR